MNNPTYHSRGALAGTKSSPMGPPCVIDPTTHRIISGRSTTILVEDSSNCHEKQNPIIMKNNK